MKTTEPFWRTIVSLILMTLGPLVGVEDAAGEDRVVGDDEATTVLLGTVMVLMTLEGDKAEPLTIWMVLDVLRAGLTCKTKREMLNIHS